jgi:hypothetical protein
VCCGWRTPIFHVSRIRVKNAKGELKMLLQMAARNIPSTFTIAGRNA